LRRKDDLPFWRIPVSAEYLSGYDADMITPGQIKAARALIGWTQAGLAEASGISEISIKKIETGATDPRSSTLAAIQAAFNDAGVVFLEPGDTRDGGPGVRMRGMRG
jgi:transcriptional regulator with XRE-family HTH domain